VLDELLCGLQRTMEMKLSMAFPQGGYRVEQALLRARAESADRTNVPVPTGGLEGLQAVDAQGVL
jgi:hypothetical protein